MIELQVQHLAGLLKVDRQAHAVLVRGRTDLDDHRVRRDLDVGAERGDLREQPRHDLTHAAGPLDGRQVAGRAKEPQPEDRPFRRARVLRDQVIERADLANFRHGAGAQHVVERVPQAHRVELPAAERGPRPDVVVVPVVETVGVLLHGVPARRVARLDHLGEGPAWHGRGTLDGLVQRRVILRLRVRTMQDPVDPELQEVERHGRPLPRHFIRLERVGRRVDRFSPRGRERRELNAELGGERRQHRLQRQLEPHRSALAVDARDVERFDPPAHVRQLLEHRDPMPAHRQPMGAIEACDTTADNGDRERSRTHRQWPPPPSPDIALTTSPSTCLASPNAIRVLSS